MNQIAIKMNSRSEEFKQNKQAMQELVDDLNQLAAKIQLGGGEKAREKHLARGKLLPRQRIERLLDTGSPFLEIGQLAAYGPSPVIRRARVMRSPTFKRTASWCK